MTALPHLTAVVRSDWDDTLFCTMADDPRTLIVWHGEPLWQPIMDAVAGWRVTVNEAESWVQYERPE